MYEELSNIDPKSDKSFAEKIADIDKLLIKISDYTLKNEEEKKYDEINHNRFVIFICF